ncbi:MAG: hypothetical protein ACK55Z_01880, partial [bacterium]
GLALPYPDPLGCVQEFAGCRLAEDDFFNAHILSRQPGTADVVHGHCQPVKSRRFTKESVDTYI